MAENPNDYRFTYTNAADLEPLNGSWHTYPLHVRSDLENMECAFKRFDSLPTIKDVRMFSLFGLTQFFPKEQLEAMISDDFLKLYLTSAINEVEMETDLFLSPVEQTYPFDYVEGMFRSNFTGMKIKQGPVTQILSVKLKFSHTQTDRPVNEYDIPPSWISFRNRRINIMADLGVIKTTSNGGDGTVFSFLAGYTHSPFRPNMVQVQCLTGFPEDRIPAIIKDIVLMTVSINLLRDIIPLLFPYSSTSVGIDGVSQSASLPGPAFLLNRIKQLQDDKKKKISNVLGSMGRNIKSTFVNS